jgi:alpha-1,2-mannosyltransferase
VIIAANVVVVAVSLLSFGSHGAHVLYRIDLNVYRLGSQAWLSGRSLYGPLPPTNAGLRLGFTYPPFAAIILSPLALIPMAAASVVITLITIATMALTLWTVRRPLGLPSGSIAVLLPVALLLEPVLSTIGFGQVNVVLMALVTVDCMSRSPRWPRGVLVGVAMAVKLTPALFILFFLLRRDYRAAGTAAASFLAWTGLGFLLAWHDSVRYWTGIVFDTGRIGSAWYSSNQSITGVLARAHLETGTPAGTGLWLLLSAVVLVVASLAIRNAFAAGEDCFALALNGLAALLISPISWQHHWVWGELAVLALASIGWRRRSRVAWIAAIAGFVIFASAPQTWFPSGGNKELHWAVWEQVVGSSYVIFAAIVLIGSAMPWHRPRPGPHPVHHEDLAAPRHQAIAMMTAVPASGTTGAYRCAWLSISSPRTAPAAMPTTEAVSRHAECAVSDQVTRPFTRSMKVAVKAVVEMPGTWRSRMAFICRPIASALSAIRI